MLRTAPLDRSEAMARLQVYVQYSAEPTLTTTELEEILDDCKQATFWAVSTLYYPGDIVLPIIPNGHRYICIYGGTSEALLADEPEWPKARSGVVADEGDLTWAEYGPDFRNIYNIQLASYKGWRMKAAKVAGEIDQTLSGGGAIGTFSAKCSQQFTHCMEMAQVFAPMEIF